MYGFRTTINKASRAAILVMMFLGMACASSTASAQKAKGSEVDAVKAANEAFYTALSARNISAIQKVWSKDADIQNIGPRSKVADVGWAAQKKGYEQVFDAFPELKVSMPEPRIKVNGSTAWVSGIENAQRKTKAGDSVKGTNLGTSIFAKQGGRWVMVYHHASAVPQ
jgi:ketosteroid isomerase-like protein